MKEPFESPQIMKLYCARGNALSKFPSSELWRLGMEVTRQNEGPEAFHRGNNPEPGYMQGFKNALAFVMHEIETPLSADMLANIHDICVEPIGDENIEKSSTSFRDDENAGYSIELMEKDPRRGYFSRDGFIELFNKINQHEKTQDGKERYFLQISEVGKAPRVLDTGTEDPNELYDSLLKSGDLEVYFFSRREKASYIKERVQKYIDEFYSNISETKDQEKQLDLIIRLVKDLEQLHPFPDANGRTISMIALNKLLIEHGFSPVMLDNPNRIDGMSILELREEVIRGMKNFNDYSVNSAIKFIEGLSGNDFRNKAKLTKIDQEISDNPLTALAQTSALYERISQNKISIRTNNFTFFGYVKDTTEKKLIKDFLEGFYEERMDNLLADEPSQTISKQALMEIISQHDVLEKNPPLKIEIEEKIDENYQRLEGDNKMSAGR